MLRWLKVFLWFLNLLLLLMPSFMVLTLFRNIVADCGPFTRSQISNSPSFTYSEYNVIFVTLFMVGVLLAWCAYIKHLVQNNHSRVPKRVWILLLLLPVILPLLATFMVIFPDLFSPFLAGIDTTVFLFVFGAVPFFLHSAVWIPYFFVEIASANPDPDQFSPDRSRIA